MTRCTGEPISWMRLESFSSGDASTAERERIVAHLATCAACAACLARIEEDDARALPPLDVSRRVEAPARRVEAVGGSWWRRGFESRRSGARVAGVVGALACAALVAIGVGRLGREGPAVGAVSFGVKGEAVAFSLVRDDGERIVESEGVYRDGDRFKAVVTCPPGANASFDVVVFDESHASFPLERSLGFTAPAFGCGNEVPLPGAFRLTGGGEQAVCLVWGAVEMMDRKAIANAAALGERSHCMRLRPVP